MTWKPHVTVAAVVERDGRFLLVEERIGERLVLNQPAGHRFPLHCVRRVAAGTEPGSVPLPREA